MPGTMQSALNALLTTQEITIYNVQIRNPSLCKLSDFLINGKQGYKLGQFVYLCFFTPFFLIEDLLDLGYHFGHRE